MKRHRILLASVFACALGLLSLFAFAGAQPVAAHAAMLVAPAQTPVPGTLKGDQNVTSGDFTLRSGQTIDGNLNVWGGTATLESNSEVDGDVTLMGGALKSASHVTGNLTVMGGSAELREGAQVGGNATMFGGSLALRSGSQVDGNVTTIGGSLDRASGARIGGRSEDVARGAFDNFNWFRWVDPFDHETPNPFAGLVRGFFSVFGMTLLGIFVALIWPRGVVRVGEAALAYPGISFGVGLLALVAFVGLIVVAAIFSILIITLCITVPVMIIAPFIFTAMYILGWIGFGVAIGERLVRALGARDITPVVSALAGVFLMTILSSLDCIGVLVWFLAGSVGLGAVILTRFGTQVYTGAPVSQVLTPPAGWPGAPRSGGPAGPVGPVGPIGPVGPVAPTAPTAPAGPAAPANWVPGGSYDATVPPVPPVPPAPPMPPEGGAATYTPPTSPDDAGLPPVPPVPPEGLR